MPSVHNRERHETSLNAHRRGMGQTAKGDLPESYSAEPVGETPLGADGEQPRERTSG